ncbi:M-phase-specific PLK1-interacting protein [Thunnus albacares]|uniref:M-phase-specific PLK1-interacting protein n=1 Tax=Thunnus maccoyii TaxID=8240 RepID=UPI001C4D2DEA|nr:M-phase-specific PLK1-interacting protein [Thunnus maccoyii]XP_044223530.1 M-phase-specific PLK1-interacting protein [Thunnus albacares]
MYRAPVRPQRSSAVPRPPGRFPSPASCWGLPGARSPYGGSPRGCPPYSPGSPVFSPGSNRGYGGGSPGGFGSGGRGFGGQMRRSGDGFWRPQSCSPASAPRYQPGSSDSVEKYFSPSMLQDPWAALQPVAAADAAAAKRTS